MIFTLNFFFFTEPQNKIFYTSFLIAVDLAFIFLSWAYNKDISFRMSTKLTVLHAEQIKRANS